MVRGGGGGDVSGLGCACLTGRQGGGGRKSVERCAYREREDFEQEHNKILNSRL